MILNTNIIDDTVKNSIINEISKSLEELGINIDAISMDINAEAINLKISLCNK